MTEERKDRIRAAVTELTKGTSYDANLVVGMLVQALISVEHLDIPEDIRLRMNIAETVANQFTGDDEVADRAFAELEILAGLLLNE